ncbi:MAG: autotransporter outer membrane beta-barrel domain-containing protein [Deltaproteobacteria bacterium]|nr:autotransporter outer membrane beta-barrel domain-containing protein [Deltaproteobacteria bacterium]
MSEKSRKRRVGAMLFAVVVVSLILFPWQRAGAETVVWDASGTPPYNGSVYQSALFPLTSLTDNTVIVTADVTGGNVFGGFNDPYNNPPASFTLVNGNLLRVSGAYVGEAAYGGYSLYSSGSADVAAEANGNTVIISGGAQVRMYVAGGRSEIGLGVTGAGDAGASGNSVTISNSVIGNIVSGGLANSDAGGGGTVVASGNTVNIDSSTFSWTISGGQANVLKAKSVQIKNNVVNMTGGSSTTSNIFGAWSQITENGPGVEVEITGNALNIADLASAKDVKGVYASNFSTNANEGGAELSGNTVSVVRSYITRDLTGTNYVMHGNGRVTMRGNSLSLQDSTVAREVSGGVAYIGQGGTATVNATTLSVAGSTVVGEIYGTYAYVGGSGAAESSGNAVTVVDTAVNGGNDVTGGYAIVMGDGAAEGADNAVTVEDSPSLSGNVVGMRASVGGDGSAGARGNWVTVSSSAVAGSVTGASAEVVGAGSAAADGNRVTVADSRVDGDVIGGVAEVTGSPTSVSAVRNTVTLSGSTNLTGGGGSHVLSGGRSSATGPGVDVFTGDTLRIARPAPGGVAVNVDTVGNFQYYAFLYGADAPDMAVAMKYTGSGAVFLTDGGSQASVIVAVDIDEGGAVPEVGSKYVLIEGRLKTTDSSSAPVFEQESASGKLGRYVDLEYDLDYAQDGASLIAVLKKVSVSRWAKSLPEAFISGVVLVDRAGDLAAGAGLARAVSAADDKIGWNVFTAFGAARLRHETGSHVDVDSLSLLLGLSRGFGAGPARLTLGAFVEAGRGEYDTWNDFADSPSVRGSGEASYFGGGLMGRAEAAGPGPGRAYLEFSVRAGRVKSDFSSLDLSPSIGSYEVGTPYRGFHAGLGYVFGTGERWELDLGVRHFLNRRKGEDTFTTSGSPVTFRDVTSSKLRVGGRLAFRTGGKVDPYLGAAWEREFDGEAGAVVNGLAVTDAPRLKGDTAMGEIGVSASLSGGAISLEMGLQGFAGRRQGVAGSVQLKIDF